MTLTQASPFWLRLSAYARTSGDTGTSQMKQDTTMEKEKLEKLLNELPERMVEPVRPGLAEDVKRQITQQLHVHRMGMDTIRIMIDLRISRLAAAAVIIITILFCANFFGFRGSAGGDIIGAIKYSLARENIGRNEMLTNMTVASEGLLKEGKKVVYYGDSIDPEDGFALLMHWKLPNGKYRVIFSDWSTTTVSSDVLILLQAQMLKGKNQK